MLKRLYSFWDIEISTSGASLLRVSFGVIAALHLLMSYPRNLSFYFGSYGLFTQGAFTWSLSQWSVLPILSENGFVCFYWATFVSLILIIFGIKVRFFLLIIWLWHLTSLRLNYLIGWQMDVLLTQTNLFLMLIPCDSLWRRKNIRCSYVRAPGIQLLKVMLSLIYFVSVVDKLKSPQWISGMAIHDFFQSSFVRWTIEFDGTASRVLSAIVILAECIIGFGLWFGRLKWWNFGLAILFHGFILIFTRLSLFSILMIALQMSYFVSVRKE